MTDADWYGGESGGYTTLLFGEIHVDRRPSYVIPHFGKDAYELYMVAAYTKELAAVRNDPNYICWTPGFNAFAAIILDLQKYHGIVVHEEVGSTLYSTIKIDKVSGKRNEGVRYIGIEVSSTLIGIAAALHPGTSLQHVSSVGELDTAGGPIVSRSYQATSYAFTSTDDFAGWISRAWISQQGAWFAESGERTIEIFGKRLHLFDFELLRQRLNQVGLRMLVYKFERFYFKSERFVSGWFIAFDPKKVNTELLQQQFRNESGQAWETALDAPMALDGDIKPHVDGIFATEGNQSPHSRSTFDFNSDGLYERFDAYLASMR